MSTSLPTTPAPAPPTPRPALAARARPLIGTPWRRVLLRLGCALGVLGLAIGVASLLRPTPEPRFVALWLSPAPSQWNLRQTAAANDLAALQDGDYFRHWHGLPAGTTTGQMVTGELERLRRLPASEGVVLYLVATCDTDQQNRLQIAVGGTPGSETIALADILRAVRDCQARGKLLVLDLAPPAADAPWATTAADLAQRLQMELDAVHDPHRIVLCACGASETPLVSETWRRSGLGYYFEQALRGDADGALDGRRDGCVTAREATAYVQRHVEHWASRTQPRPQRPLLVGQGNDFPLVTVSAHARKEPSRTAANVAAEPITYPKWLAAAWDERLQMAAHREFQHRPRLLRRWEQVLLRAEEQWRGGRAPEEIQSDLRAHLEKLRGELRSGHATLPDANPFSLAQLNDGQPLADAATARKALKKLLDDVAAKTQNQPPEKAAAARSSLIDAFGDKTKKLPDAAIAVATVDELTDRPPAAKRVKLLDDVLRRRQPQPLYVETLLLRRLAQLASRSPEEFDADLARRAVRVAGLRGEIAGADRTFPWTLQQRGAAAQWQHNGEYLLLRPGFVAPARAQSNLARAEKAYEGVIGARDTLRHAYQTLDAALLRLPLHYQFLQTFDQNGRAWLEAIEQACWLVETLDPSQAEAAGAALGERLDAIEAHATALERLLMQLDEPFTPERTTQLIRRAAGPNVPLRVRRRLDAALRWPGFAARQRAALLEAKRLVAAAAHEKLVHTSRKIDSQHREAQRLHEWARSAAEPPPISRVEAARALFQLGGVDAAHGQRLKRSQAITDFREQADEIVHHGGNKSTWNQARLGSILPVRRTITWLDDVDTNPNLAIQRSLRRRRYGWLAEQFAYRAHDDTPVLNAELSRRYAAVADSFHERYVRFDAGALIERPSPSQPSTETTLAWQLVGASPTAKEEASANFLTLDNRLRIDSIPRTRTSNAQRQQERTIRISIASDPADDITARGILVELEAFGRTWHQPLQFRPRPWASALQLLIATEQGDPGVPATSLRLRPAEAPQAYFLSIANPTERDADLTLEIPGVGTATLSLPAGSTKPIFFTPPKSKPAADAEFEDALPLVIRNAKTGAVLAERTLPLDVLSPQQYVRVVESRFYPGEEGDNRLLVKLQAENLPPGPPCFAALDISRLGVPGLITVNGGTLRGELPAGGQPLMLEARGLQLVDGYPEDAEFSLTVDGVRRAMTFAAALPRRGDPTSPSQVARPSIALDAPPLALAGPGFQVPVRVLQAPADASIHLRIGEMQAGGFVTQVHRSMPRPRRRRITAKPQKDGSIALQVALDDWVFDVDTSGLVGPRTVRVDIVDGQGRSLAGAQQKVTFDDSPPEQAQFAGATNAFLVNKPIKLQIVAGDGLSGVDKVMVFPGRPVDGKPPQGVKPVPAEFHENSQRWQATLPPQKVPGPLEVTAQVVNGVNLSTFAATRIRVVEKLDDGGAVQGVVLEGPRPQPQLEVQLLRGNATVVDKTSTDPQGNFMFNNVKPGKYRVHAVKKSSGRKASKQLTVQTGKAAQVTLELTL